MLNTDDFIKRLEQLLAQSGLSAAAFADKIGVQRSSISHLLSGRNKPSLDFVLKIIEAFPEVDLYWILTGKQATSAYPNEKRVDLNVQHQRAIERIVIFYADGSFSEYNPK